MFIFRAIEIDGSNQVRKPKIYFRKWFKNSFCQVYYCNRAAAFSKINNHYAAIEDCKRAIDMDPKYGFFMIKKFVFSRLQRQASNFSYGKAYGRLGLAYSSIEKHKEAVECFQRAIEIEPDNDGYKSNLKLAQERLQSVGSPGQSEYLLFSARVFK